MAKARQFIVSVADRPGTVAQAIATLADAGVSLLSVLGYLGKLAKKKVNLRSLCATSSKTSRKAVVVWTAET